MPHEILAPHIGRMADILSRTVVRQHFGDYMNPIDPNCLCATGLLYYHLVNTKHHEVLGLWKFDPSAADPTLGTTVGSQLHTALENLGFPRWVATITLRSIIYLNDVLHLSFAQIAALLPELITFYLWAHDNGAEAVILTDRQLLALFFKGLQP